MLVHVGGHHPLQVVDVQGDLLHLGRLGDDQAADRGVSSSRPRALLLLSGPAVFGALIGGALVSPVPFHAALPALLGIQAGGGLLRAAPSASSAGVAAAAAGPAGAAAGPFSFLLSFLSLSLAFSSVPLRFSLVGGPTVDEPAL